MGFSMRDASVRPLPSRRYMRQCASAWRALLVALFFGLQGISSAAGLPEVTLEIAGHKLTSEVAATDAARSTGLMHRRMMPENRGMLFIFPTAERHGMWMMNTYLPLSVAFIASDGTILNIEDMEPHTQNTHSAVRPAKYALEMNKGWFGKRDIKPGVKVMGLEKAGAAR